MIGVWVIGVRLWRSEGGLGCGDRRYVGSDRRWMIGVWVIDGGHVVMVFSIKFVVVKQKE